MFYSAMNNFYMYVYIYFFSKQPLLQDILETNQVYVSLTKINEPIPAKALGEGLFARQNIHEKGLIIAFFNGIRKRKPFRLYQEGNQY